MAISETYYSEMEKQRKGYLDINAYDFYFNKMRPFLEDVLMKCRTDEELTRTIYKVMNASDSFCQRKQYDLLAESFDVLEVAITDKNYFNGVMKKAPESEKEMVRELIGKIADLRMIIKCEPKQEPEEKATKDRIGYSPIGENEDYSHRNMATLNEPTPKRRIPNV